jgi:DUF1365 family protein
VSAPPRRSAVYRGTVSHARLGARAHAFSYGVYLLYLDLDELPSLLEAPGPLRAGRLGLLSFRRSDYLAGPEDRRGTAGLAEAARARAQDLLGVRPEGPVRLLTSVRSFGYVFNPVSFYFCFAADGRTLQAVVAEVSNTPWGERHVYAVPAGAAGVEAELDKRFHVSPFFGMAQRYRWRIGVPGERLEVELCNEQDGREVFRARLALRRHPWSAASLWRAALGQPFMSWKVHAAIYWQALRLWLKGVPFHPHPAKAVRRPT